jgi:hypothetical protein
MDNGWLTTIWNLINTGGVIFVLILILWLFLKGQIIPRVIYMELTKYVADELYIKFSQGVREVVTDVIREVMKEVVREMRPPL